MPYEQQVRLQENITLLSGVDMQATIDLLVRAGTVGEDERAGVLAQGSASEQAQRLIDLLSVHGPHAYSALQDALVRTNRSDLVDAINETVVVPEFERRQYPHHDT